ncbi:PIN domain-containing protein [uncultured Sphingomonas sp.]|uniref:PIN domain-containing protein n=1 Tax=uncultured Sphingomonas sp. TaxID=158754 RepID=UPI0035CB5302
MILVDTNVFSELTKPRPEEKVVDWLFEHRRETLLSTIVVSELAIGIRTTRGAAMRALLGRTLDRIVERHAGRIVPFDLSAARRWGEMGGQVIVSGGRSGVFDSMLAAQALVLDVAVATRNIRDFEDTCVRLIDPWTG